MQNKTTSSGIEPYTFRTAPYPIYPVLLGACDRLSANGDVHFNVKLAV
jgi:hypothetical protein